jgi:hypothetical protein
MPKNRNRRRNKCLTAVVCLALLSGFASAGVYLYSHPELLSLGADKTTYQRPDEETRQQTTSRLTQPMGPDSMCTNIRDANRFDIANNEQGDSAAFIRTIPEIIVAQDEESIEDTQEANRIDDAEEADLLAQVTVTPQLAPKFEHKSPAQSLHQSKAHVKSGGRTHSTESLFGIKSLASLPLPAVGTVSTSTTDTSVQTNNQAANTTLSLTDSGAQGGETLIDLSNPSASQIVFENDTRITGLVQNDGIIYIDSEALLTLSGDVTGNGSFVGDVLINGSILPGNSPGLLTFDNVIWNNTNLLFEVESPSIRGTTFDGIDINGDLQLIGDLMIDVELWNNPLFSDVSDYSYAFVNVVGDLLDSQGSLIRSIPAQNITISDGWLANWVSTLNGWTLQLTTAKRAESVDAPSPILLLLIGIGSIFVMRRQYQKQNSKLGLGLT